MYLEFSDKSGSFVGVGPHYVCEFYLLSGVDVAGTVTMRIAGISGGAAVSGEFRANFARLSGVVTVGATESSLSLVAPAGCTFEIVADSTGDGVLRGVLTGIVGLGCDGGGRCDVWAGP